MFIDCPGMQWLMLWCQRAWFYQQSVHQAHLFPHQSPHPLPVWVMKNVLPSCLKLKNGSTPVSGRTRRERWEMLWVFFGHWHKQKPSIWSHHSFYIVKDCKMVIFKLPKFCAMFNNGRNEMDIILHTNILDQSSQSSTAQHVFSRCCLSLAGPN